METTGRRRGEKYMEGHLEFKEASKWVPYWVVIRGRQLFIFKDANTQIKENIQGHVDIGTNSYFACGKTSKGKFEFEIKADGGKKYLFRANTEILRLQWVHTLGLAAQGKLPPASPDPATDNSSNNNKETVTSNTNSSNQYSEVPHLHNPMMFWLLG
ncbi:hypothetical protein OS493_033772 [Desmophyllum pertusum]|uniref:PH domain-containing protein n=1 Tax=Desmophyllum pertusum TaxID=174260 RepID=A0A9W9Z806_9CNID|nr:hypothetical protein OS493_033772 [Desmophyllum pertusum]